MSEQIVVTFPPETMQLITSKMREEGVKEPSVFLSEILVRALSRRETSAQWGEIIQQILVDSLDDSGEDTDESTILIFSSEDEE